MSKALARAVRNPPAIAPDMLDVAGLLLGAGRGQTDATKLTLIDAAIILLDRAREGLASPASLVVPAAGKQRRKRRARVAREVRAAPAEKPEPAPKPKPAPASAEEAAPEILDHNGVTVTIGGSSASVEHADRVVEVTVKQGRLVACLARAMPQPVDRKFAARQVWAGQRLPEFADQQLLTQLCARSTDPLAGIGLTLKTVRGVGIALQKEGE